MLNKEFTYYKDNQEYFVEKYNGQYIVLQGTEVIGTYSSQLDAYLESVKEYELGTFLIQHVAPGEESYTIKLHSRAF